MRLTSLIIGIVVITISGMIIPHQVTALTANGGETKSVTKSSDPPTIDVNRTYGGEGDDSIDQIVKTDDGNYFTVGRSAPNLGEPVNGDEVLRKLRPDGSVIWTKRIGDAGNENIRGILKTSDGFLLVGEIQQSGSDLRNGWVVKVNSTGQVMWTQTYGWDTTDDLLQDVAQVDSDEYMIVGSTNNTGGQGDDGWLLRIFSGGQTKYDFVYDDEGPEDFFSVTKLGADQYILAGQEFVSDEHWDAYVLNVDATGETRWTETYGHSALDDWIIDSAKLSDDRVILVGQRNGVYNSTSRTYDFQDAWTLKIDANGLKQSSSVTAVNDYNRYINVETTPDGGYIATGYVYPDDSGNIDGIITKYNASDGSEWSQTYGGNGDDLFSGIVSGDQQGQYFVGGYTPQSGNENLDAWFVSLQNQSGGSDDDGTRVRLSPDSVSERPGSTTSVDLRGININNGIKSYSYTVTVSNTSVATISDVELVGASPDGLGVNVTITDNNRTVMVSVAQGDDNNGVFSTLTLRTQNTGIADLQISQVTLGDDDFSSYNITATTNATIEVSKSVAPPAVVGNNKPTDPDGDGKFDDITGDGTTNILDVGALLQNRNSPTIQNNADKFDFTGDGRVNILDVGKLLQQVL